MNLKASFVTERNGISRAARCLVAALLEDVYKYSSTQINVPAPLADFVIKWGRKYVPEDALYYDPEGGCGRETEPHITVLYGLTEAEPTKELLDLVRQTRPFTVRLGPVSLFTEHKDYDVVKFGVASDDLHVLSDAIRAACPNENKYPDYQPHCTVAYCKKDTAKDLAGVYPFETDPPIPNEFEAAELVFSAAGDDANAQRLQRTLPFNRYRQEVQVRAKDLLAAGCSLLGGPRAL